MEGDEVSLGRVVAKGGDGEIISRCEIPGWHPGSGSPDLRRTRNLCWFSGGFIELDGDGTGGLAIWERTKALDEG
jgi:hypothetical protein